MEQSVSRRQSGTPGHPRRDRLILLTVLLAVCTGLGFAYLNRNVHRVEARPGQVIEQTVTLKMQRPWRSKNFASEFGLPVVCQVMAAGGDDVSVRVLDTGHGLHHMWARLEITVHSHATPGRRTRLLDFSIDGEGDWPRPVLHVDVR